jgi:hypothetical protein
LPGISLAAAVFFTGVDGDEGAKYAAEDKVASHDFGFA